MTNGALFFSHSSTAFLSYREAAMEKGHAVAVARARLQPANAGGMSNRSLAELRARITQVSKVGSL